MAANTDIFNMVGVGAGGGEMKEASGSQAFGGIGNGATKTFVITGLGFTPVAVVMESYDAPYGGGLLFAENGSTKVARGHFIRDMSVSSASRQADGFTFAVYNNAGVAQSTRGTNWHAIGFE